MQLVPINTFFMPHCSLQTKSKKMQAWPEQDPSYWNSQPPRSSAVYLISCEAANGSCCAGIKSIMAQQINAGPNKLWLYYLMQNLKKKKKKYSTENQRTAYSLKTTLSLRTLLVCACVCVFLKAVLSSFMSPCKSQGRAIFYIWQIQTKRLMMKCIKKCIDRTDILITRVSSENFWIILLFNGKSINQDPEAQHLLSRAVLYCVWKTQAIHDTECRL